MSGPERVLQSIVAGQGGAKVHQICPNPPHRADWSSKGVARHTF